MLEIKVTGSNKKELINGLETLLAAFNDGPASWDPKPAPAPEAESKPEPKAEPKKMAAPKPEPDPAEDAPKGHQEEPEPDDKSSYYTLPQIRAIATDLIHKDGGREKLKAILENFGVAKLPELDPKDFAWFADQATQELK